MKVSEWTRETRHNMIDLCVEVSEDIGEPVPRSHFEKMSNTQLDAVSDWYFELSLK